MRLIYEHGTRDIPAGQYFAGNPDTLYGKFERFEAIPNDPDALQFLLQEEKHSREQLAPGDFKAHIAVLHDGLIETEARRIVAEMKRRDTPNSPNRTHFMVELSNAFTITLPDGGNYIGIECEDFTGNIEMNIE